ncbi:hypothetical protein CANCADRAFT_110365 [Tortispora caseinolytica NRRL Y-17796]|uniref:MULE transposase domain-containing protein n=1 Tax=Tortispora caseinolytica NRRL Y-17796 TaxID=767744 RepID=A0A1E4TGB6_9ASCO|nr:hypothetical protein CANCADRAFT_110365 [Tortispora caseinolytica NRRL Y-17796]
MIFTFFVNALAPIISEVVIDSTFSILKDAYHLYGVLAALDGAVYPICYFCLSKKTDQKTSKPITAHTIGMALHLLSPKGVNPSFVHIDKDRATIRAVSQIWGSEKIRVCAWHALRAVRTRGIENTSSINGYRYADARAVLPDIQPCFASAAKNLPDFHRSRRCDCSWKNSQTRRVYMEKERTKLKNALDAMFAGHITRHEDVVDGTTNAQIYKDSVRVMYEFCLKEKIPQVWAYMWKRWYCPEEWMHWAQASRCSVPILKTTMGIEGHWSVLKGYVITRKRRSCRVDAANYGISEPVESEESLQTARPVGGIQSQSMHREFWLARITFGAYYYPEQCFSSAV